MSRRSTTKQARPSPLGYDVARSTIFDRTAGVIPFRFAQQYYARKVPSDVVETQQRSVPDALDQAMTKRFP